MIANFLRVGIWVILSRIFGFMRDLAFASFIGAGAVADAFFVGVRLPQGFRALLGENAINAAMVPKFQRLRSRETKRVAFSFSGQALSTLLLLGATVVVVVEVFARQLLAMLAPGLMDSENFELIVFVCRLSIPFSFFTILVCWQGALLSAFNRFSAFAFTWIGFNLFFLMTAGWLYLRGATQTEAAYSFAAIFAPAMAFLSLFLFWVMRREGLETTAVKPKWLSEDMRVFRHKFCRVLGAYSFLMLNGLITIFLASFLPTGAISYLYYAERLIHLPVGALGVAVAMVLLPSLSVHIGRKNIPEVLAAQNHALSYALLFSLPAMVGLVLLADEIMRVLFVRGSFTHADAASAASALKILGLMVPFFVWARVFIVSFYARGDAKTPMKVNALCCAVNLVVAASLMRSLGYLGLAVGMAAATVANTVSLWLILKRRGQIRLTRQFRRGSSLIIMASIAMGGLVLFLKRLLPFDQFTEFLVAAAHLAAIIGGSVGFYMLLVWTLGLFSLSDLKRLRR